MKKMIVAVVPLLAIIAAIAGVFAMRAATGASGSATPQGQADIFSTLGSPQDSTNGEKPWLGAAVVRTPDGLTVSQVIADSPADKAGLKRLDVLKSVDGAAVSDMAALRDALQDKQPGDTVTLSITRDGSAQDITVTLEARPEPLPRDHPVFPELNGIPRDELFSHMLGGAFQFTDKDGNEHTANVDLGTVSAVDTTAKTISVHLNTGDSKTYSITEGVLTFPDDLTQFQSGDKVIVISVDDSLRAVMKGGRFLPFFGGGHGRGHHGGGHGGGWDGGEHGFDMMPGLGSGPGGGLDMPGFRRAPSSGNPGGM